MERIERIKNFLKKLEFNLGYNLFSSIESLDNYNSESEINEIFLDYRMLDTVISIDTVINFLKDKGSKYVYNEHSYKSPRPRWKVFKNAFISWYFKKKISTIEKYKNVAKKQKLNE